MIKSTYGTGCFALLNIGERPIISEHRMLTTVAYRLNGTPTYAIEGAMFVAGAAVKWLRDKMGVITHASQTHDMATQVPDSHGVYLVPAFVGLGAPHWDPDARGAIFGLTLDSQPSHIARAALESVAFQTRDIVGAMIADGGEAPSALRVDGGMVNNDWLCQLSRRHAGPAGGAAPGGGDHGAGRGLFWRDWRPGSTRRSTRCPPAGGATGCSSRGWAAETRARMYAGWQRAVRRTLSGD